MKHLERTSPESLGIPSRVFTDFYKELELIKFPLHHFIFLRHGKIATQGSWAPYEKEMNHMMYSTSKTITSLAVGFCIDDGLLKLDDRITDFFPELITGPLHEYNKMRTVRNLLVMATGEGGDAKSIDRSYPNWLKTFLNTPPRLKPGTLYGYDSSGTHALSAVVQRVTGKTMEEYLYEKLFKPLDIEGVYFESQMGINTGSRGFHCKIEDIAKIALMIHQDGMYEGKRIISKEFLDEARANQIEVTHFTSYIDGNPGYGYYFWLYRDGAYGSKGHGGNMFVIYPKYDVIFAFMANFEDGWGHLPEMVHLIWNRLFNDIHDNPLKEDPEAYNELLEKEASLKYPVPEELKERSPREDFIDAKKYVIAKNPAQIHDLVINKKDRGLEFTFTIGKDCHEWKFEAGHKDWLFQNITETMDEGWVRYFWRNENVLECVILLKEKLGSYHLNIYVNEDDDSLSIDMFPVGWRDFNRIELFAMGYHH